MTITVTSPITGSAQTGLTSPTYTLTLDTPPSSAAKQNAVTALGGTQTGVDAHSVARPFTVTVARPSVLKVLSPLNPNGQLKNVPRNVYKIITRKGVTPLAGQPAIVATVTTEISIPAGSDLADAANLRAMLSAHIGTLSQQSAGIGDTAVSGLI